MVDRFDDAKTMAGERNRERFLVHSPGEALVSRLDMRRAAERLRGLFQEPEESVSPSPEAMQAVVEYDCLQRAWDLYDCLPKDTSAELPPDTEVVTGFINRFDHLRGFGFISRDDGDLDVLFRVQLLRAAREWVVREGALIRCEVARRRAGSEAIKVLALDNTTAPDPANVPRLATPDALPAGPWSDWALALVLWFDYKRGAGCQLANGEVSELFAHMETLRHFGVIELWRGQAVEVRWGMGIYGPRIAEIRLCSRRR